VTAATMIDAAAAAPSQNRITRAGRRAGNFD